MAKKGIIAALQIDISTEEDWEKLKTEKQGVILVDVYTEWCGPCVGMCGNLKKVKLEVGGENITYVTAKSDTIEDLARFRKKSEPTWMFISAGRMTNLMYGPDGPRLMRMIVDEVKKEQQIQAGLKERVDMAITDIAPEEQKRLAEIEELHGETVRIERELQQKKADERRMEVALAVAEGMPDYSFIILWPHAVEAFSEIMEICEGLELQLVTFEKGLLEEELLSECFFGADPISPQAIKCLLKGISMVILLQAKEEFTMASVQEALMNIVESVGDKWLLEYTGERLEEHPTYGGEDLGEEEEYPRLEALAAREAFPAPPASEVTTDVTSETGLDDLTARIERDMEETVRGEWELEPESPVVDKRPTELLTSESGMAETTEDELYEEEEEVPHEEEAVLIAGIYTPVNDVARGAGLAILFQSVAAEFIPPPPVPIPPHVAIVFDAFKKKDVLDMAKDNVQYIMNVGFFTTADASTAQLVAKTNKEFDQKRPGPGQKLVIMVMKKPSAGLLSLAQLGPIYVSPNAEVGQEECKKFFPPGYSEGELFSEETVEKTVAAPVVKKKKKGKKVEGEEAEEADEKTAEAEASPRERATSEAAPSEAAPAAAPEVTPEQPAEGGPPGATVTADAPAGGDAPTPVAAE